jgi:hypothetical protein
MKVIYKLILTLSTLFFIVSCSKHASDTTKNNSLDTTVIFATRWNIVSDSIANINNYWDNTGEPIPGFYSGVPNDYFNFLSNGTCTASEIGLTGSGTYQLLPDSGISISLKPALKKAKILILTASALKIVGSDTSATGGILNEILIFKR